MRKFPILLMSLLLTACVDDSASYYIDGGNHALTLRRQQTYFWKDQATLLLIAAHLPECERRHVLAVARPSTVDIEVFASGDGVWTLRSGSVTWQVETQTCTVVAQPPKGEPGERVGAFKVQNGKLVFERAGAGTTAATTTGATDATDASASAGAAITGAAPAAAAQ